MAISYSVRTSACARNISITVHRDGRVIVSKPARVSDTRIAELVEKKTLWIESKIKQFSKKPPKLLGHYSAKDFKENKKRAQELVRERITHFNSFYQYDIARVVVRNQSSRWGSCSRKKNLSFNYKIVFLPPELADYIIVHELCHLQQMNHSQKFWDLVAKQIPNYKALRTRLRAY